MKWKDIKSKMISLGFEVTDKRNPRAELICKLDDYYVDITNWDRKYELYIYNAMSNEMICSKLNSNLYEIGKAVSEFIMESETKDMTMYQKIRFLYDIYK